MGSTLLIDGLNFALTFEAGLLDALPLVLGEVNPLSRIMGNVWLGVQVALGLGFVIFVHELGHFLAAKTFGVRCDKFYVGFDVPISIGPIKLPRTLGKFQWGETEYGIGIIPLGGYVKMLGQDDDPRQAEIEAEKIRQGEGADAPLDPRSYPAKPVWQRMIIISAGVVMNLIFAVILAAVAYWFGVPYTPTVAGSTLGGGPAWVAGIQAGDQVLKFGDMQEDDPHLRYGDFAVSVIMQGFDDQAKPLPVTVLRGDKEIEVTAVPTAKFSPDKDLYRIGLIPPTTPKIAAPPFSELSFLAKLKPDLEPGDVITSIGGEQLPVDQRYQQVLGSEVTSRLQANFEKPISVTIERPAEQAGSSPKQVTLELPPVPVKSLGLGFAMGPITALQSNSAAAKSGLQIGDVIVAINGEPVDNALRVPARIGELAGQEIKLTVVRPAARVNSDSSTDGTANTDGTGKSTTERLDFTLAGPQRATFDPISDIAGELTMGGMGIAFGVKPQITSVEAALLEDSDGIQVGDELLQVQWLATPERKKELGKLFRPQAFKTQVIDETFSVASMYDWFQSLPAQSQIRCWVRRDGKTLETVANLNNAEGWFWHQRGVALSQLMSTHETTSIATALNLGLWETARRFQDVLDFLRLLVTGKIGAKGVGGPIAIAEAAGSEASYGVSRLMIFLTLLSANLAILNFLPIPALDGGHMLFLIAEAIRGKPVNEALQVRLTMMGVLGLLSLMAFVIVKDIMRLMT